MERSVIPQPVGELRIPRLAQTIWFSRNPCQLLDYCQRQFGPTFFLRFSAPFGRVLVISEPKAIAEMYEQDSDVLCGGMGYAGVFKFMQPNVLICQGGEEHRSMKEFIQPLLSSRLVDRLGDRLGRYLSVEVDRLANTVCDTRDLAARVMLRWSTLMTYGVELAEDDVVDWCRQASRLFHLGRSVVSLARLPSLINSASLPERIEAFQRRLVAACEPAPKNLADQCLAAAFETATNSPYATPSHLASFWTFLFGSQTVMLTHIFHHLLEETHHVMALRNVTQANEDDRGGSLRQPDPIRRFNMEVRRLSPDAVGAMRGVKQPTSIAGVQLRPGDNVMACVYLTHRRAQTFHQPLQFDPDRFIQTRYSHSEYCPFGVGERACLGRAVAVDVADRVVAMLLKHYQFEPCATRSSPVVQGMGGLTMRAKPMLAKFRRLPSRSCISLNQSYSTISGAADGNQAGNRSKCPFAHA